MLLICARSQDNLFLVPLHQIPFCNQSNKYLQFNVSRCSFEKLQIGPFELPARLNRFNYLDFLQNDFPGLMEDVDLERRRNIYFQQDGAPPHFGRNVRQYLNNNYGNHWIGRAGPIAWPPRSPDLTPLDYYLWGHVKSLVYAANTTVRLECLDKINGAFDSIRRSPDLIARATGDLARRLDLCRRVQGHHFEQYPHHM